MKSVVIAVNSLLSVKHAIKKATFLFPEAGEFYLVYLILISYSHFWSPNTDKRALERRRVEEEMRVALSSVAPPFSSKFTVRIMEGDPDA